MVEHARRPRVALKPSQEYEKDTDSLNKRLNTRVAADSPPQTSHERWTTACSE